MKLYIADRRTVDGNEAIHRKRGPFFLCLLFSMVHNLLSSRYDKIFP